MKKSLIRLIVIIGGVFVASAPSVCAISQSISPAEAAKVVKQLEVKAAAAASVDGGIIQMSPSVGVLSSGGGKSPWIARPGSNSTYQFNHDESSWIFARERCLSQNADLVSINDQAEMDFVLRHYPLDIRLRDRFILLGLSKSPVTGWNKWLDGTDLNSDINKWVAGEPSKSGFESCAFMTVHERTINRVNCDTRVLPVLLTRYVCERKPGSMLGTSGGFLEQEKQIIMGDDVHQPIKLWFFLRKLAKLGEMNKVASGIGVHEKVPEQIDLEINISDPPEKA